MPNVDSLVQYLREKGYGQSKSLSPEEVALKTDDIIKEYDLKSAFERRSKEKSDTPYSSAMGRNLTPRLGDISAYSKYLPEARINLSQPTIDETRAQNQTRGQLWKGIVSQAIVGHMIGGTIENIGTLFDFSSWYKQMAGTEREWGQNLVQQLGASIKDWAMHKGTPIHMTKRAQEGGAKGMMDRTWWASHAPSVFTSASLMIPVFGVTRGLSALGRALKIGGKWSHLAKIRATTLGSSLMSRHMYSTTESVDNYNQHYEHAKDILGLNEEEAIDYASRSATLNYRLGWLNIWKDVASWGMLLRYPKFSNMALRKQLDQGLMKPGARLDPVTDVGKAGIAKATSKKAFKPIHLLYHSLLEGFEEYNIQWQKKEGKRAADIQEGFIPDSPYDNFLSRIKEHTTDPHTFDSFFWGMAGGLTFGLLGRAGVIRSYKSQNQREQVMLEKLNRQADFLNDEMNNILKFTEEGDTFSADKSRANIITSTTLAGATAGTIGIDIQFLKNLSEANEATLAEYGYDKSIQAEAARLATEIESAANLYDKLKSKSYGYGKKDAYIVAHLFSNELQKKYAEQQLKKANNKYADLQREAEIVSDKQLSGFGRTRSMLETNISKTNSLIKYLEHQIEQHRSMLEKIDDFAVKNPNVYTPLTVFQIKHSLPEHISDLELQLNDFKTERENLQTDLKEHTSLEDEAVKARQVLRRDLKTDREIMELSNTAELAEISELTAKISETIESSTNEINKILTDKSYSDKFISDIEKFQEEQIKIRNSKVEEEFIQARNETEVNELLDKHGKEFKKTAEKAKQRIKADKIEQERIENETKTKPTKATTEAAQTKKETIKPTEQAKVAEDGIPGKTYVTGGLGEFHRFVDSMTISPEAAKSYPQHIPLYKKMAELLDSIASKESLISENNIQRISEISELSESLNLSEHVMLSDYINNLLGEYKKRIESNKKVEQQSTKSSNTESTANTSDKVVTALNNFIETKKDNTFEETKEGSKPLDSEDTPNIQHELQLEPKAEKIISTVNNVHSDVIHHINQLVEGSATNSKISMDTLFKILNARNDKSLEHHFKNIFLLFGTIRELHKLDNHNKYKLSEKFDLTEPKYTPDKKGLESWKIKNEERLTGMDTPVQAQSHNNGVYVYLHDITNVSKKSTKTKLNTQEEAIIKALNEDLYEGAKVTFVVDLEHKDDRYKGKALEERNQDPNKMPVKIRVTKQDGSFVDVGFIQELGTDMHGVRYTDEKGNFNHFGRLLVNNSNGKKRFEVILKHFDVLKRIYEGKKVDLNLSAYKELKDLLYELVNHNKPESEHTTSDLKAIRHIIKPFFYNINTDYIDEFNPTQTTLANKITRHISRYATDFKHNKEIRNLIKDGKLELTGVVENNTTPQIMSGNSSSNLNHVIKPIKIDGKDKPARVVLAHRGTKFNNNSSTLYDVTTGEEINIVNPHVLNRHSTHKGFYTILEYQDGQYYAHRVNTNTVAESLGTEYSNKVSTFIAKEFLKLLNLNLDINNRLSPESKTLKDEAKVQRDAIGEQLNKFIIVDWQKHLKLNYFGKGEGHITFITSEPGEGYVLNKLQKTSEGKLKISKSKNFNMDEVKFLSDPNMRTHTKEFNINDIETLASEVGMMLRNINLRDTKLSVEKMGAVEQGIADPVSGKTYSSYFDFILGTGATTTSIQALTNSKGEVVSNFNPSGTIRTSLFIKPAYQVLAENQNKSSVHLSRYVVNPLEIKNLDDYISKLPEMSNYGFVIEMAKTLGVLPKIKVSSARPIDKLTKKPIYAELDRSKNLVTLYDASFERTTEAQSATIVHEVLHTIINEKIEQLNSEQRAELNTKLETYVSDLESSLEISELNKQDKDLAKSFIEIAKKDLTEVITYTLSNKHVARILGDLEFKTSKGIKTSFWNRLKDLMMEILGISDKGAIQELTNILNETFKFEPAPVRRKTNKRTKKITPTTESTGDVVKDNIKTTVKTEVGEKHKTKKGKSSKSINRLEEAKRKLKEKGKQKEIELRYDSPITHHSTVVNFKSKFLDAEFKPIC